MLNLPSQCGGGTRLDEANFKPTFSLDHPHISQLLLTG
jgi:hypothetical protein